MLPWLVNLPLWMMVKKLEMIAKNLRITSKSVMKVFKFILNNTRIYLLFFARIILI